MIQPPSGESKNATRWALSCGKLGRPNGARREISARSCSESQPVSVGPGLMQLTRIPRDPSSDAAALTMRSSALAHAVGNVLG